MAGIEFAAELGASSIIFEPGPSTDWPPVVSDLATEGRLIGKPGDTLERFLATAQPYFRRAEELGINVALEVPHVATVVEDLVLGYWPTHIRQSALNLAEWHANLGSVQEGTDVVLAALESVHGADGALSEAGRGVAQELRLGSAVAAR